MMRRLVGLTSVLLVSVGMAAQITAQSTRVARPNVVMILMDDMGYGDIGSYGVRDARTPNLDRLAREGVRLTDAYANASNCSPTRAGFIMGQYQQRYRIEWPLGAVPGDSARGLAVTGAALPALLKRNGYATGLIGKWHLGFKPDLGPNAQGFDEFFGFMSGAVDYYTHRQGDGTPDLYENTAAVQSDRYLTDDITSRATSFVEQHVGQPFFLEVAFNAVHWPFEPPDMPLSARRGSKNAGGGDQSLYDGPDDERPPTRADYVKMLERADQGVGKILADLDRLGLTRNTLVIFTNDNGGEWLSRNAPFRDRKSTLWEGGIRVPMILRWPGVVPRNKTSAQTAITMDLTATILAVTGTQVPATHKLDGIDLMPILTGRVASTDRELFWRRPRPLLQRAVRSGKWKLVWEGTRLYLFDLATDPGEQNDLTATHEDLVRKLRSDIEVWEKDVDAPNPEVIRKG